MPEEQQNNNQQPRTYTPVPPLYGSDGQQSQVTQPRPADSDMLAKHNDSKLRYPVLNLSTNEYVIQAVRRHPIGLLSIWFMVGLLILIALAFLPFYAMNGASLASLIGVSPKVLPSALILTMPDLILVGFFALGGFIATVVYQGNHFFLTNESVIQFIRPSLFHTQTQIVNLVNVEDASFDQRGIIQQVFNYGTIRLSTKGEETIYHFYFVSNPAKVVNAVNDAAEIALKRLEAGPA